MDSKVYYLEIIILLYVSKLLILYFILIHQFINTNENEKRIVLLQLG
jgi:hypothetical protein